MPEVIRFILFCALLALGLGFMLSALIGVNRFGAPSILYYGMDQLKKKWLPQETYGGKLTENITQAIARDCLARALLALDQRGYHTVMHVHDEAVVEVTSI